MSKPFQVLQYRDAKGKTPSDHLVDLLDSDVDVMQLAADLELLKNGKDLLGAYFNPPMTADIRIWAFGPGPYRIMYSCHAKRHELCILLLVNGPPRLALPQAECRVRQFYQF